MLRIVFQFLLALSLVLQGSAPVLAAVSARANAQDDCMLAMTQDEGGKSTSDKQDCCKRHCTPAACIQMCTAGCMFLAPAPFALIPVESARTAAALFMPAVYSRDEGPPVRPPIV